MLSILSIVILAICLGSTSQANHVVGWSGPNYQKRPRLAGNTNQNQLDKTFEQEFHYPEKKDFNKIKEIIQQFDNPDYLKRAKASKDILKFGGRALRQLKDAMDSVSLEVQERAKTGFREIMSLYTKEFPKKTLDKFLQKQLNEIIIHRKMNEALAEEISTILTKEEAMQLNQWSLEGTVESRAKERELAELVLRRIKGLRIKSNVPELTVEYKGRELRWISSPNGLLVLQATKAKKFSFDIKSAMLATGWSTPLYRTTVKGGEPISKGIFPEVSIQNNLYVHKWLNKFSTFSMAMIDYQKARFLTFETPGPPQKNNPSALDGYLRAFHNVSPFNQGK